MPVGRTLPPVTPQAARPERTVLPLPRGTTPAPGAMPAAVPPAVPAQQLTGVESGRSTAANRPSV